MPPVRAISIHAPVKGATLSEGCSLLGLFISIHAPVKGATSILWVFRVPLPYFNPRSREGSDPKTRVILAQT